MNEEAQSAERSGLTYRIGRPEDLEQVLALLERSGLHWPGELATAYVAVTTTGQVKGVFFKTLCFHAEPFCADVGAGVSASEFARLIAADFQELANERGIPVSVYCGVQDTPKALEAARKNGMRPTGLVAHEITFLPSAES